MMLILMMGCSLLFPLQEGSYRITTQSAENTCGADESVFGAGEKEMVTLVWDDTDTIVLEYAEGADRYDFDGNETFSMDGNMIEQVTDDCSLSGDIIEEGTIVSSTKFNLFADIELNVEGACRTADTSAFPCSVQLKRQGVSAE